MYTISKNKHFISIFYKNTTFFNKKLTDAPYNLVDVNSSSLFKYSNSQPMNTYYVSNIYLCRYVNWIVAYLYIYSTSNLKTKIFKNTKKTYYNLTLLHQIYTFSKNRYKNLL